MGIKAIIDKLEDVDDKYRDLYTERNGRFELTGVEGMRTEGDVTRLSDALTKERNDHKTLKAKYAPLGNRDVNEVLVDLDRIPVLEEAAQGRMSDKKIDELVTKQLASKTAPLERDIIALKTQLGERDTVITTYKGKEVKRTIDDSVRDAVGKSPGFQQTAVEDALVFGGLHLTVNDDGKVVTKDSVGVTPGVDAVVWLTEMQQRKAHWWGSTTGGGAGGNRGGTGGGTNPWTREQWNMTEQGRVYTQNPQRAEQMAKAAGTTIGGQMPVKK